jgi:predicted MPP superfamily phosphohydrolase
VKILCTADIHIGRRPSRLPIRIDSGALSSARAWGAVVEKAIAEKVDLVAVAGDLVEGTLDHLADATEPLRDLRSTHGTFFVTGNHEYHYRYTEWVDHVRTLGVRPLLNEHTTITHNGGEFALAGLVDPGAEIENEPGPDLPKTLRGWNREQTMVLLSHQPATLEEVAAEGVDLQLSGHTHGGQIAPFNLLVKALEGTVAGMARLDDTQMYVTRGAGFYGPPMRVGAPPDISIVELHS